MVVFRLVKVETATDSAEDVCATWRSEGATLANPRRILGSRNKARSCKLVRLTGYNKLILLSAASFILVSYQVPRVVDWSATTSSPATLAAT